jgi:hypothetical protein
VFEFYLPILTNVSPRLKVVGLFSINVVPFSSNAVPGGRLFSINLVPEQPMFLGQRVYVLGPLHLDSGAPDVSDGMSWLETIAPGLRGS